MGHLENYGKCLGQPLAVGMFLRPASKTYFISVQNGSKNIKIKFFNNIPVENLKKQLSLLCLSDMTHDACASLSTSYRLMSKGALVE